MTSYNSNSNKLLTGQTPFFASTFDQRFSFSLFVPTSHLFDGPELPVLVIIHGTRRQTGTYLTRLKDFSEQHRCVIFCPLFPAGIIDPGDMHNYKTVLYRDIRFDLVLLSMLDQAAQIWKLKIDKFFMHGFSGGGQFAQRFFYLHPHRLAAVSIGAPGRITPPDITQPWPAGLSDVHDIFGLPNVPNFHIMNNVPVKMVVGANDLDTSMLDGVKNPNTAELEAGDTRVDRLKWLARAWMDKGVSVELTLVPGLAHNGIRCLPVVEAWMGPLIDGTGT
jgi:pimeloyl-ACP methyl ester carboxylesterase